MEKGKQIIGIMALLIPLLAGTGEASPIGYNTTEGMLHVWNNGSIEPHYYYSGDCLNQISNMPNETWEIVEKYLGTYLNNEWYMLKWDSEQECIRSDDSDFLTYSNNTALTEIHIAALKVDLEMKSHIKTNDDLITQIYRFKANRNSQTDVWFMLEEKNISISGDTENDYLKVWKIENNTEEYYNLSSIRENEQVIYLNSSEYFPFSILIDWDKQKTILNEWINNSYDWVLKIDGNVSLLINLGEFERNENKYFTKKWIDASCICSGFGLIAVAYSQYPNGTSFNVGDNFLMRCATTVQGLGGGCAGCTVDWKRGNPAIILINKSAENPNEILECPTATNNITRCIKKIVKYGSTSWHNHTLTCLDNAEIGTRCLHEYHPVLLQNNPSVQENITCLALPISIVVKEDKKDIYPFILLIAMFSTAIILNKKNGKEKES